MAEFKFDVANLFVTALNISSKEKIADTDVHNFNGTQGLNALLTQDGLSTVEHCITEQFQNYMHGVEKIRYLRGR